MVAAVRFCDIGLADARPVVPRLVSGTLGAFSRGETPKQAESHVRMMAWARGATRGLPPPNKTYSLWTYESSPQTVGQDMATIQQLVGGRVRELRKAKGWSLEVLAEKADKHYTYIGGLERGTRNVTLEVLQDVAHALGVPIKELFTFLKHPLEEKLNATSDDILSAIDKGFRATIDAKGKLAEYFLFQRLAELQTARSIRGLVWFDEDGKPDFEFVYAGRKLRVECKNVRSPDDKRANDSWRVEIQKTRNSKDGTPTRAYPVDHFDLLSVCLFNRTGEWDYLHIATRRLQRRPENTRLLAIMQSVPQSAPSGDWKDNILEALSDIET